MRQYKCRKERKEFFESMRASMMSLIGPKVGNDPLSRALSKLTVAVHGQVQELNETNERDRVDMANRARQKQKETKLTEKEEGMLQNVLDDFQGDASTLGVWHETGTLPSVSPNGLIISLTGLGGPSSLCMFSWPRF